MGIVTGKAPRVCASSGEKDFIKCLKRNKDIVKTKEEVVRQKGLIFLSMRKE